MYHPDHIAHLENATGTAAINKEIYTDARANSGTSTVLGHTSSKSKQFKAASAAIRQQAHLIDPNDQDALKRAIDDFAAKDHSQVSKKVIARRTRISNMWFSVANYFDKSVTEDNLYHYDVVKSNLHRFLPTMVQIIKPLNGHTVIRSSTLAEAFHTIVTLVLQYTFDPRTNEKKGFILLTKEGLFVKLQDQLKALIQEHKLERVGRTKLYYGREHLQILISCMLSNTNASASRRTTAVQSICRILLTFYASCRPSTTGYTEKKLRDAGLYPKLENVRIYRRAEMNYEIEFDFQHFKAALRTVNANRQVITLHGVLMAHNGIFDPTIWFLALFFLRGDFAKKYQTMEELCDDKSAEILLDHKKGGQALFLAINVGGKGFIDPPQPSTAAAATDTIGHWCEQAGLPRVGATAFRRDAGNMYGQQLGLKVAKLIMNHHEGKDVFNTYYSRTTNNIQLVNFRLGEIRGQKEAEPGEALRRDRQLHLFKSTAVEFMMRGDTIKATQTKNRSARSAEVVTNPKVLEIESNIQRMYQDYLKCFSEEATHYKKPNKQNVTRIFTSATGEKKNGRDLKDGLFALYANALQVKRSLMRKGSRQDAQTNSRSYLTNPLTGTAEEREAAVASIGDIMPEVKDAVRDYLLEMTTKNKDKVYDDNDLVPSVELPREVIDSGRYKLLDNADRADEPESQDDRCQFNGNLQEWSQALCLGIQVEQQIQEEEEELDKGSAKMINLLKNITKPSESESSGESSTQATAPVECDEDFLNAPDIDESRESDVLNLPVGLVKRALLEKIVEPILRERGMTVFTDNKLTFPCTICTERGKPSAFKASWYYERHMVDWHSPWKELESQMTCDNSASFRCPAQDGFVAKTVKKVFNHMVTDKCSNSIEHIQMKDEHDAHARPYHKYQPIPPPDAVIRRDNKNLKDFEESMEWLYMDGGSNIREFAESVYALSSEASMVDWESLGLGKFIEVDFDTFRFQEVPEKITLLNDDY